MGNHRRLRVSLLGDGDRADRWANALCDLAEVRRGPQPPSDAIDALVVAPGAIDPFARAKDALQVGVPVLYAAPFLLSRWQVAALVDPSQRQGCLLRFAEPVRYGTGLAFLRRLLRGKEPFWRPLYLRTLCLARPDGSAHIDELATEEIAICAALLDGEPRSVTAAAGRTNEAGEVRAAFLILHYPEGPVVQCTISLAEAVEARQLVAATPERTVVMDDLDPATSLRIMAGSDGEVADEAPAGRSAMATEGERIMASPGRDPITDEAKRFLDAVAAHDVAFANGERWERVAAIWWAARESMTFDRPKEVPVPALSLGHAEPPPLRVIEGGGKTAPPARRRPSLTVVAR